MLIRRRCRIILVVGGISAMLAERGGAAAEISSCRKTAPLLGQQSFNQTFGFEYFFPKSVSLFEVLCTILACPVFQQIQMMRLTPAVGPAQFSAMSRPIHFLGIHPRVQSDLHPG